MEKTRSYWFNAYVSGKHGIQKEHSQAEKVKSLQRQMEGD